MTVIYAVSTLYGIESKQNESKHFIKTILSLRIHGVAMQNDDEARGLLAGSRRSQSGDTSTRTYYDMQQPSSTAVRLP